MSSATYLDGKPERPVGYRIRFYRVARAPAFVRYHTPNDKHTLSEPGWPYYVCYNYIHPCEWYTCQTICASDSYYHAMLTPVRFESDRPTLEKVHRPPWHDTAPPTTSGNCGIMSACTESTSPLSPTITEEKTGLGTHQGLLW